MKPTLDTKDGFKDALKKVLELEYDTQQSYEIALNKIKYDSYKAYLNEIKLNHERRLRELTTLFTEHNEKFPINPNKLSWTNKLKLTLAYLLGDKAILATLKTQEDYIKGAYSGLAEHQDIWTDAQHIIMRSIAEEKQYHKWFKKEGML